VKKLLFILIISLSSLWAKGSADSSKELLALSWQNAFCELHRYIKECKNIKLEKYTDTKFGLHGLWPQPRNNIYCGVSNQNKKFDKRHKWGNLPSLNLTPETIKGLKEIMAGYESNLHKHEWIKHGTCSNLTPDNYYKKAISLTKQINDSKVGQFFAQNIGKRVTLQQVRFKMNESFGFGSGKKVEFRCRQGMITELWIHLGSGEGDIKELLKNGKNISSRCKKGKIDRVGF